MSASRTSNLAMVFPGQGSQSIGMLAALAERYDTVRATYSEASTVLGYDLWKVVSEGPDEALNRTECTQPAMLAAGVAVWRIWRAAGGPEPTIMAGHSLGEYTALVAAGALAFGDALRLVEQRGRLMQDAVPAGSGAMAAVLGLDNNAVMRVCDQAAHDQVVSTVNFNSPGQVVIAGHTEAVQRAMEIAKQTGARRAVQLPISVPSHSSLMRSAAEQFAALLANVEFKTPNIPVIHNADVASHSEPDAIAAALARQIYSPVRWVETITALGARGVDTVIEAGPGKVLAGLNRRIDKRQHVFAVYDPDSLNEAFNAIRKVA